jgi:tetratricopeptide (TPR) repeat protein
MKNLRILFCFVFFAFLKSNAQKMPEDYFEEGNKYVYSKEYAKAIASYQYIVSHHKKNELYSESFYNLAYTHVLMKNYKVAIAMMRQILTSDFNEMELIGGDIMSSPFANYRNRASNILSDIYYEQKKYDSSLYYLVLSDTVHRYEHFCGNEIEARKIYLSLQYADLYQKLKDTSKAVSSLLKTSLTSEDNSHVLGELKKIWKKEGEKNLKSQLDKALSNAFIKEIKGKYHAYYFVFLGREIAIPLYLDDTTLTQQQAIKEVKQSAFYKMISGFD